jgi:serine/threonine protein kinase
MEIPLGRRADFLVRSSPDVLVRTEVQSLLEYTTDDESFFKEAIKGVARSLQTSHEVASGDAIGAYRIISLIGRGGTGSVYLAERSDGKIQQRVAVKLLHANGPLWLDLFRKECQFLAALHHPFIVRMIDAGHTEDGRPYLVMEHVEGVAIDAYAAGIEARDRLILFLRVCEAVSHAHR